MTNKFIIQNNINYQETCKKINENSSSTLNLRKQKIENEVCLFTRKMFILQLLKNLGNEEIFLKEIKSEIDLVNKKKNFENEFELKLFMNRNISLFVDLNIINSSRFTSKQYKLKGLLLQKKILNNLNMIILEQLNKNNNNK